MKVYVVTAGTYSDYHIERVFTDESMALAYIEAQKDNDMCIETYDVNEEKHNSLTGYTVACIDGKFYTHKHTGDFYYYDSRYTEARPHWHSFEWTRELMPKGKKIPLYVTDVVSENEEKALKIAQDRWAKFKAEKAGIV